MVDRFPEPDFEPETTEQRDDMHFTLWRQRKVAERLAKAAEKAKSGDRRDLREYLKLRRNLL